MSAKTPVVDALLSRRIVDIKIGILMDKILVDGRPTDLLEALDDLARSLEAHCESMITAFDAYGLPGLRSAADAYVSWKHEQLGK